MISRRNQGRIANGDDESLVYAVLGHIVAHERVRRAVGVITMLIAIGGLAGDSDRLL